MNYKKILFTLTAFSTLSILPVEGGYTLRHGRLVNVDELATLSLEEHYAQGIAAAESHDWKEAALQFNIVCVNFPNTSYGQESCYHLGVALFYMSELDVSNDAFSKYLKVQNNPKYFQNAIEYKFNIAERFRRGALKRFFGTRQLPKWLSGKTLALEIYDEVICAVPSHEIAAQALFSKASLLWETGNFRECIDSYQLLVKRFPKHELAPQSFAEMIKVYLNQSEYEFQNPDILAFAEIALRNFIYKFPRDERICEAEQNVLRIKEIYAKGFYETGKFYERINKPRASIIYYQNAIHQFPETAVAERCRQRLGRILPPGSLIRQNEALEREENQSSTDSQNS